MIVCICNAIRESQIRTAARNCPGDAEAVYRSLGCAPQCRQCLDDATDILDAERCAA
ncbi:(2Fe-2S)-binding protein [uncultured Croceicoccus sp.]|uniref:(2Fe-2S)-binding protein n=1 Tax=uncultured Croceicoccus sp. TaxID=1295329 RepID=UPI002619B5AC|nr:(2Fe-2S)-binding protein [uncultured Croceicoccus sp.]